MSEVKGPWKGTGRQLGGIGPLKVFPSWVSIIYLKDCNSISKLLADEELNPPGSVTKHAAVGSQI